MRYAKPVVENASLMENAVLSLPLRAEAFWMEEDSSARSITGSGNSLGKDDMIEGITASFWYMNERACSRRKQSGDDISAEKIELRLSFLGDKTIDTFF